jgi:hypothetical protein
MNDSILSFENHSGRREGIPMTNPWQALKNTPPFSVDTMMLLTDASIMCHELESPNWHRLVPDAKGSYVNGT